MVGISMALAVSAGLLTATILPFVAPLVANAVVVWAIRSRPSSAPDMVGATHPIEQVGPIDFSR